MYYQDVSTITRQEAESAFSSGNSEAICNALVSIAYHDPDWRWVQNRCLLFCKHPDPMVRGLATTCIGHLARIHKVLDLPKVIRILKELQSDSEISGRAQDAMDDIKMFLDDKSENE